MSDIKVKYPHHPVVNLLNAITLYYQYYPLLPSDPQFEIFVNNLQSGIAICELEKDWLNDAELLLIDFSSRVLLMLCYSENDLNKELIPVALGSYKCIRKSFDFKSAHPDFCYFTGLYNYYREAYPEHYPLYKPVAMFFPKGNKKKDGLNDLEHAAGNALLLKAESYSILSWIYNFFEKDYQTAIKYSRTIYYQYPSNLMFRGEYIKNLLFLNSLDEAEKLILASAKEENLYFKGQLLIPEFDS